MIYLLVAIYLVFAYVFNQRVKTDVTSAWRQISRYGPTNTNTTYSHDLDEEIDTSLSSSANIKLKNQMAILSSLNEVQKGILHLDLSKTSAARIRAPLVIVTCGGGMLVAFTITFIKGATNSYALYGLFSVEFAIFAAIAIATSILQLKFINLSMEIYDQVETIPIFQSA